MRLMGYGKEDNICTDLNKTPPLATMMLVA